jgi:hypothetical protein
VIVRDRLNTVRQLGLGRRVGRLRTMIGGVGVASLVGGGGLRSRSSSVWREGRACKAVDSI